MTELKHELEAMNIKIKEETENFVMIKKLFWRYKSELEFLEIMRKYRYELKFKEDPAYVFEKCKN